jgi:16S rRNA (adenine(1408)-N(1))-methyltransferase
MIHQIKGKKVEEVTLLLPTDKEIIIELGCGDGKLLYKLAKSNLDKFYIGIDSNEKGLEDISLKISKKPAKGGLDNIIFLKASAESLPDQLSNQANEILVNFPWGSLLSGLITNEELVLKNIIQIAKNGANLEIFLTYNEKFEDSYIQERDLPTLSYEFINNNLRKLYESKGIIIKETKILSEEEKLDLQSSWAKKILRKRNREIFKIDCIINK